MTRTIPHFELLRRVRARDLGDLRGEALEIRCDRLSAVLYRDVADLALAIARVGPTVWRDARGREEPAATGAVAGARLAAQAVWHVPRALLRHRGRLRRLDREAHRGFLDRPRRLLYLRTDHAFDVEAGGSVAHTVGVVGGLRDAGLDVDVVSTDRVPGLPDHGFHEVVPEYGPLRNVRDLAHLDYDRQLRAWLERRRDRLQPDVVYHRHALFSTIGPWLQRDWGVPFVCEYNGSFAWMARHWDDAAVFFPRLLDRAERRTLTSADLVVTVSDALRDDAVERGADPDRVLVEPNAVDPERYRPDADDGSVRAGYGIPADAVVVGFIGTFGPWHGARVLARAAARLAGAESGSGDRPGAPEPELRFLFIGEGQEMPLVRRIIDRAGLRDRVTLAGLVPQAEGPAHLAACDILASPHVPNPDGSPFFGSPTKVFEYMATGRAIVASDLDQIGRVLDHDRTAVLVPPGDDAALAAALAALAGDPERRARLGRAARERVLERHTWTAHTERILSAMSDLAEGNAAPPGTPAMQREA